ncbi:LANO_0C05490g1_1 [Lachancea nothofagi CBS 11611]|uniref:LANO_0C05490g1_1 n=1 Tax=Lachancea nothofagi CBS 11611 TaxID=1266666 RepID=A0A1G4J7E2_9SACH|nr:LANO_0C05490g1_1 [Lachancea nothofagi CBS 11611]
MTFNCSSQAFKNIDLIAKTIKYTGHVKMAKLSEEYFDLVRQAVREDNHKPKRKKRKLPKYEELQNAPGPASIVVTLDSDGSDNETQQKDETREQDDLTQEEDEDFNSDDFEDISDLEESGQPVSKDISVTLDTRKAEPKSKSKAKNVISNDERKFRRYFHMLHLLTLMVHGFTRNNWLNDPKLHKKLSKLVPDDVFELLHPKKDDELPLRSTRKLLDGLKKCMEIWWKHFDQITRVETRGLYMMGWDELDGPWEQPARYMSQKLFNKKVALGKGSLEVGAQGFVAMLRACGVNARLVLNAQPPDFTNNKIVGQSDAKKPGEYLVDPANKQATRRRWKSKSKQVELDQDRYSIFWCEVWDKISKKWITVDPMGQKTIEQIRYKTALEPQGKARQNNVFRYIIAYDRKQGCRDVTRRYTINFNSKTRKRRVTKDSDGEQWYNKVLQRLQGRKRTRTDDLEDSYFRQRDESEGIPDNMQDLKSHPFYVLENDLKWNEVLKTGCKQCGFLRTKNNSASLKVFRREDILVLKTARAWYTEGRVLKPGAKALKTTKSRDFKTGEATEERLYPIDQTDLLIPKPLGPNKEVPTNVYGNIDIYTNSMIPEGACLIESPVAVKAAAFLRVEFAKAVTGFKFEKKRIVKPQITGIVAAQEYREAIELMIDGIEYSNEEDKRQEIELESLQHWNLMLAKLRIKQRLISSHGKVTGTQTTAWGDDDTSVIGNGSENDIEEEEEDDGGFEAGGFLPDAAGYVPETAGLGPKSKLGEKNDDDLNSQAGGFEPQADDFESQISGLESQPGGFELQANEFESQAGDFDSDTIMTGTPAEDISTSNKNSSEAPPKEKTVDEFDDYEDFMKNMVNEESEPGSSTNTDSDFNYESE